MSGWSPPSLSREWRIGIALFYVFLFVYFLIFLQRLLTGIFVGSLIGLCYIVWRFLIATEAIADALHRIAHQREQS